jgi:hypothetical protein
LGAGIEFATNIRDEKATPLLRSVQRKISSYNRFALLRDHALPALASKSTDPDIPGVC